ncbi:MAG TPA: GxxExxY protein [Holophagaceae bacterium]|nr:GxxExxY protein [Holophagaceae bacterium]
MAQAVVDAAIAVHHGLGGCGFLEAVYEEALAWELESRSLKVERQRECPVIYRGRTLGVPLRLDLVVEGKLIVECKATSQHSQVFEAQMLTHLRVTSMKLGLLVNFGVPQVKDGIRRVVNNL